MQIIYLVTRNLDENFALGNVRFTLGHLNKKYMGKSSMEYISWLGWVLEVHCLTLMLMVSY